MKFRQLDVIARRVREVLLLAIGQRPCLAHRGPRIQIARGQRLARRYQAAGTDHYAGFDHRLVHHDGAHADQAAVVDLTAMQDRLVSDRDLVADDQR